MQAIEVKTFFIFVFTEPDRQTSAKKPCKKQQQRGKPMPTKRPQKNSPATSRPKKRARIDKGIELFFNLPQIIF